MKAAQQLTELLGLRNSPVAISFVEAAPPNVPRISSPAPSGCSYWKYAAQGQTFHTVAADHYNCPIGAFTHGIELPPDRAHELEETLSTMINLGYLRHDESPPRRNDWFAIMVYSPLAEAVVDPDIVLISGNAKQMMFLWEAAQAAGMNCNAVMGRPTCAAVPQALQSGDGVASLGCIGNRVYTELADDELYFVFHARHLAGVIEKLNTIIRANRELESYHRGKAAQEPATRTAE